MRLLCSRLMSRRMLEYFFSRDCGRACKSAAPLLSKQVLTSEFRLEYGLLPCMPDHSGVDHSGRPCLGRSRQMGKSGKRHTLCKVCSADLPRTGASRAVKLLAPSPSCTMDDSRNKLR